MSSWIGRTILGPEYFVKRVYLAPTGMVKHMLKMAHAKVGQNADIQSFVLLHNVGETLENLSIGDESHIGKGCFLDLADRITIENNVTISMNTTILTHTDVGKSPLSEYYPRATAAVFIQAGAYIGACSVILPGTTIGENAVIAAGAIVTRDVQKGTLVAGTPARLVRNLIGKRIG